MIGSRTAMATIVGAAIGGLAGYLFFTAPGHTLRHKLEPAIDDFSREMKSFRRTVEKAAKVAAEGWELLNGAMADGAAGGAGYTAPRQSVPF